MRALFQGGYWWIIPAVFALAILLRLIIRGARGGSSRMRGGRSSIKGRGCCGPGEVEAPVEKQPPPTKGYRRSDTEALVCKRCGASLVERDIIEKSGLLFVNCPYCKTSYSLGEESR